MNEQQYDELTPEQQNIAAAVLDGWSREDAERGHTLSQLSESVPDYLNDLNACHELEKRIPPELEQDWQYNLEKAVGKCPALSNSDIRAGYRATAAQRCKAIVLTMTA